MSWTPPRAPRPSKRQHYVMVLPDTHVGYIGDTPTYSLGAWDIAMQALAHRAERLTHLVFLGDFGNWESCSHWASLRAEQCFIEEDVALVNARLAEVEAIAAANGIQVVFCEGNHEAWAGQMEAKYPMLRDTINLRRRLLFKERGWTWVPENHFWAIGDAHFTHGHLRGVKGPRDMVRITGASVIYGHTHRYRTESSRNLTGEHAAWELGCLASFDPPPPYAKGALPDQWVHGFGFVQVRSNGRFQVSFRRVIDEAWTELEDGTELRVRPKAVARRYAEDQAIRDRLRAEYGERFYHPGGQVVRTEPHHGKVSKRGEVSPVARTRRARIVRTLPGSQ